MQKIEKRLLTTKEAANYIGVSKSTLYRMEKQGVFTPNKTLGGQRRFRIEELDDYLNTTKTIEYKDDSNDMTNSVIQESNEMIEEQDKNNEEDRGKLDPRNKLNQLTGKEWMPETKSFWYQKGLGSKHPHAQIERQHPAPFSFQDISRLVNFFTKEGQMVLDPFSGVGSTVKACAVNNRIGTGIELSPQWHELAKERIEFEVGLGESHNHNFINGDSTVELKKLDDDAFDLVVTSPPYWSILNKKADHKVKNERLADNLATNYSEDKNDLGNISDYNEFLDILVDKVFIECGRVLKPKSYMCLVVSDFRNKSEFISFHSDLIQKMNKRKLNKKHILQLQGVKALLQNHKSLLPYGYPFAYVENIHHQYILIFRKV